jgi:hypothetical protein
MAKQKLNYDKSRFKNDAEYKKFLDDKMKELFVKIDQNIDVFKRLADR